MGYECRDARFSRQTRLKRLEQLSTNGRPESILRMIGRSAWLAEEDRDGWHWGLGQEPFSGVKVRQAGRAQILIK